MRDLGLYTGVATQAIAEGATTPNPGFSALVYSSTTGKLMYWTGTQWTSGGGGSTSPGGSSGDIQFNNGGAFGGVANVEADNNDLVLANNESPVTPPTDRVKLFNRKLAARNMLGIKGPSGLDMVLQPSMARNKIGIWMPSGNSNTVPGVFGMLAPTALGTATARNVATTNFFTRMRRMGYVSSAAAASFAGFHVNAGQITLGDTVGSRTVGGFFKVIRFGISDAATVSGARMFVGIGSAGAPTNVEPSTLTNHIGVGHGASDTNLKLYYGGSAAQTPIDLGANFPLTLNAVAYELVLFCPPGVANNASVSYQVTNLSTGTTTSGTLTAATAGTQLPSSTTLLSPSKNWRCTNAATVACGLDIMSDYIETDD